VKAGQKKIASGWSPKLLLNACRGRGARLERIWKTADSLCRQRRIDQWQGINGIKSREERKEAKASVKRFDWELSGADLVVNVDPTLAEELKAAFQERQNARRIAAASESPAPENSIEPVEDCAGQSPLVSQTAFESSGSESTLPAEDATDAAQDPVDSTPDFVSEHLGISTLCTQRLDEFIKIQRATLTCVQYRQLIQVGAQWVIIRFGDHSDLVQFTSEYAKWSQ
jgi:hypothetical protein